jgi:hypothetical protein
MRILALSHGPQPVFSEKGRRRKFPPSFGENFRRNALVSGKLAREEIRRANPIEVFTARCQARAHLFEAGELDLHEVVDVLQDAAECTGVVTSLGQDAVQTMMADAFQTTAPVHKSKAPARPTNEPYHLVSRHGVASTAQMQRKCGKSFWTFHMVMHVALGWKYRGRRVQQGAVVYLALEGGKGFEARIEAFRQRHLPEHHDQVPFFLIADALNLVKDHSELIWLHSAASSRKCAGRSGH